VGNYETETFVKNEKLANLTMSLGLPTFERVKADGVRNKPQALCPFFEQSGAM
jgi:hypothetical protein